MKIWILAIIVLTALTACTMQRYTATEAERTREYLSAPDPTDVGGGFVTDGMWSISDNGRD